MVVAQIYECPNCGDVWRGVEMVEMIDIDRDEVWHEPMCSCGRLVEPKLIQHDGEQVTCYHGLTDEEIMEETYDWSEF